MPAFVHLPTYFPTCSPIYLTIWLVIHPPIPNTSACLLVIYVSIFILSYPMLICKRIILFLHLPMEN